jgi:hypothetical protein
MSTGPESGSTFLILVETPESGLTFLILVRAARISLDAARITLNRADLAQFPPIYEIKF